MNARAALADLLRSEKEWRRFFRSCCEAGALRLRYQARQFRDELGDRNQAFLPRDVEDALMAAACKALPGSPAAGWDADWAAGLCAHALARLAEHSAGVPSREIPDPHLAGLDLWADRMQAAELANDPAGFRAALRGWELAARRALDGEAGEGSASGSAAGSGAGAA